MNKLLPASMFKVQDYTVSNTTVRFESVDALGVGPEDIAMHILHLGQLPDCRKLKSVSIVQTRRVLIVADPTGRDVMGEFPL